MDLTQKISGDKQLNEPINYEKVSSSEEFKQLLLEKKKCIYPYTLFYMAYSLLLPFLVLYTDWLNVRVIGDISLAWVYGVSIIVLSLWICSIYVKKSAYFDEKAKNILVKEGL